MDTAQSAHRCPNCNQPIPAGTPQGLCPPCVLLAATAPTESEVPLLHPHDTPPIERVAAAFLQLEIVDCIGQGGMGFVYKARQTKLNRWVALKILPERLAQDPRFAERFHREGQTLARLAHPNIVSVHDFGESGGFCFLIMEYVDGVNLRQAMGAGRFSPAEALSIVPEICKALQYAHEQGIMHRDIKPENILLDSKGVVKIVDFGIAKLLHEEMGNPTLTQTGGTLGTPHYMAPEQLEQPGQVDHRADIYSLGVVFYEMLTGELPLGRFAPPSEKTPVDRAVDDVVFRTLEKERSRRYQTAAELGDRVRSLTSSESPSGRMPETGTGPGRTVATVPPRLCVAAFVSALLTALSFVFPVAVASFEGVSAHQLWSAHGPVVRPVVVYILIPAVGGTLLGWMALHRLRAARGALRGIPFAVFGALTWPCLILLSLSLLPARWISFVPANPGGSSKPVLTSSLLLIAPAATLTFLIWMAYRTTLWTQAKAAAERRGVLKWVFLGLLIVGVGTWANRPDGSPRQTASTQAALATAGDPVQAMDFRVDSFEGDAITLISSQRLAEGEALVARVEYPDGEVEDLEPELLSVRSSPHRSERLFQMTSFHWSPVKQGNWVSQHDRREIGMEGILSLARNQFLTIYRSTSISDRKIRVQVGRRVDPPPQTAEPSVTSITLTSFAMQDNSVSVRMVLRGPLLRRAEAVGTLNDQVEVAAQTRIYGRNRLLSDHAENAFQWTLPPSLGASEVAEINRQLHQRIDANPTLSLSPGERIPLFSVADGAGSVFTGALEMPHWFQ